MLHGWQLYKSSLSTKSATMICLGLIQLCTSCLPAGLSSRSCWWQEQPQACSRPMLACNRTAHYKPERPAVTGTPSINLELRNAQSFARNVCPVSGSTLLSMARSAARMLV